MAGAQPVGVGAGLDDGGFEGDPVHDRGAQPWVGEGAGPFGEGGVGGHRDAGAFLAFGEYLEEQFRAAPVQFQVAQFVQAEQVDAAVAGDAAGQALVVGGLDELVDQGGGGGVADPVAGLGGGDAQPDEQVALAGAGVTDEAQRLAGGDPRALGQGVAVKSKLSRRLVRGKPASRTSRVLRRSSRSSHSTLSSSTRKPL